MDVLKKIPHRHFCPSCHQKRVVEFGEWLCMDVLKKVPHRHFVLSIPKILRQTSPARIKLLKRYDWMYASQE